MADGLTISPAEVAPEDYPLLVTFGDMQDPTSVTRVGPTNLAASFRPGVRLKHIVLEVTDDDVTTGIEQRLPKPDRKSFFNLEASSNPIEDNVLLIKYFVRRPK